MLGGWENKIQPFAIIERLKLTTPLTVYSPRIAIYGLTFKLFVKSLNIEISV